MQTMDADPKGGFGKAKKAVLEDVTLSNYFKALCKRYSALTGDKLIAATTKAYAILLPKVIHSRFAVIFRRWKEVNVKSKDKIAFRTLRKVEESKKKESKNAPNKITPDPKERRDANQQPSKKCKSYSNTESDDMQMDEAMTGNNMNELSMNNVQTGPT